MDNQHKKISGYRDLSQAEIDLMNELKRTEADIADLLNRVLRELLNSSDVEAERWVSIARTHLETGMMFAIKAVARPTNGLGRRKPA